VEEYKMTYRHTLHLHGDYLDGDLSPQQETLVEKHVSECPRCREDLEKLKKLTQTLKEIQAPDPGDNYFRQLNDTLMARTASVAPAETSSSKSSREIQSGRRILMTLIRLAAAITLLFMAFYISDFNQERQTTRWTQHLMKQTDYVSSEINVSERQFIYAPFGGKMLPGFPSNVDIEEDRIPEGKNLE
jgi:hypothetical protein